MSYRFHTLWLNDRVAIVNARNSLVESQSCISRGAGHIPIWAILESVLFQHTELDPNINQNDFDCGISGRGRTELHLEAPVITARYSTCTTLLPVLIWYQSVTITIRLITTEFILIETCHLKVSSSISNQYIGIELLKHFLQITLFKKCFKKCFHNSKRATTLASSSGDVSWSFSVLARSGINLRSRYSPSVCRFAKASPTVSLTRYRTECSWLLL